MVENYRFGTLKRRLPYNVTFGLINYFVKPEIKFSPIETNIERIETNFNIIFVLGESVRADHLQLNGYHRNTTPLLSQNKNIISYPNVYTPFTYTASSVPQILTSISVNKEKSLPNYSLYSILNNLSFETTWIGNQTPEKSYSKFIEEHNIVKLIDPFHSVLSFSFNKKLDEELIPPFKSIFKKTSNQFITLHMVGSHWWYENRYSDKFRKYKPIIKSKHIPSLNKDELINSYDNTILYLDNFLSEIISEVIKSSTKTILIYLSDHGETLGENGIWLHAQENESSKNPAMLIWYSDNFQKEFPEYINNLKENSVNSISTDFFYHSILDLLKVQNFNYDKSKSIFSKDVKY